MNLVKKKVFFFLLSRLLLNRMSTTSDNQPSTGKPIAERAALNFELKIAKSTEGR